jgi:hypothetical protein
MQRVNPKKSCYESTVPQLSCHLPQNKVQQERVQEVEQYVHPVVPSSVHTEKFHINHMRYPCHGMPVRGVESLEAPQNPLWGETFSDMGILVNINVVVERDKGKTPYLPIHGKN